VTAFPVQDAWIWQMHESIPLEDQTHETLWRQLLRWLVSTAPQRLAFGASAERVAPGEVVTLSAEAFTADYHPLSNAEVQALVISPTGAEEQITLTASGQREGEYQARFAPQEQGVYELRLQARAGEEEFPAATAAYLNVNANAHEYYQAEQQAALLKQLAADTGGNYYTAADAAALAQEIRYTPRGTTVPQRYELWNMPIILLLLIGLSTAEWSYRRWRGLA
jgi:hypothetical protein